MGEEKKISNGADEETDQLETVLSLDDLKRRLRRFINAQPDIMFTLFLELLDLLAAEEVIKREDIELLIRTGIERWTEQN